MLTTPAKYERSFKNKANQEKDIWLKELVEHPEMSV